MLKVCVSNRFEILRDRLLNALWPDPATPFEPEWVVVGSAAMRRRLMLDVARRDGICARLELPFLGQWIWQQIAALTTASETDAPFESDTIIWTIDAQLRERTFTDAHPRLQRWLAQADDAMRHDLARGIAQTFERYVTWRPDWLQAWTEGRACAVDEPWAAQRAPDAMTSADAGGTLAEDEAWQAALWRRLFERAGVERDHPAERMVRLLHEAGSDRQTAQRVRQVLPRRLHVFCLPTIAPGYVRLLEAIATQTDTTVWIVNPCRHYWFDIVSERAQARLRRLAARDLRHAHLLEHREVGNALLANWGRQTRSQIAQWIGPALDAQPDDGDFSGATPAIGYVELFDGDADELGSEGERGGANAAAPPSLLARVQRAILDLEPSPDGPPPPAETDRSIEVHGCHSRLRELEVLQDRLLGWFADDPSLRPDDVLVAITDLDACAPLIEAVFGTATGARRLPYVIGGQARTAGNPALALLVALIAFLDPQSHGTAPDLLMVLDHEAVRRRFGIDARDHEAIVEWVRGAGYRRGLGAPQTGPGPGTARRGGTHTLAHAMDRLLVQYARPDGCLEPFGAVAPLPRDGLVAGQSALALARWDRCVDAVRRWHRAVAGPRAAADWPPLLLELLDEMAEFGPDDAEALREVRVGLGQLRERIIRGGAATLPVSPAVIARAVRETFDTGGAGAVPTGAVTFAPIRALRMLPYRRIAVIGLDEGVFPRPSRAPDFDLMAARSRPTDVLPRADDRALFLDLLIAARDALHLSHVGRGERDDKPRNPSVCVDELLDWLAAAGVPAHRVRVDHPLQPFAAAAYVRSSTHDPRLRGHDPAVAQALRLRLDGPPRGPQPFVPAALRQRTGTADGAADDTVDGTSDDTPVGTPHGMTNGTPVSAPDGTPDDVTIDVPDLLDFVRDPSAHWLRQHLGTRLFEQDDSIDASEPLSAPAKTPDALKSALLDAALAGADRQALMTLAAASNELPDGTIGAWHAATLVDMALALARHARTVGGSAPARPPQPFAPITLDVDGARCHIVGSHTSLHPSGIVLVQYRRLGENRQLQLWVRHLLLCAAPPAGQMLATTWIGLKKGSKSSLPDTVGEHAHRQALTPDVARRHLTALAALYLASRRGTPPRLFPRTSVAWAKEMLKADAPTADAATAAHAAHAALRAARSRFGPPYHTSGSDFFTPEGEFAVNRLLWRGIDDPVDDVGFARIAGQVVLPMLRATAGTATHPDRPEAADDPS